MIKTITTLALLGAITPALAQSRIDSKTSVESAYYLCALIDGTKMSSAPCDVSGWGSKVTATIDMTGAEARKVCDMLVGHMRDQGRRFDSRWTLQIKSPYSGDNSIAYCSLG